MSDFGILPTGFSRKRLSDIIAEKDAAVKAVFGPDINLNPQSPEGQINQNSALSDDQLWQIAEDSFNATDPDKATGIALSNLVKINRITRLEATATRVVLICTGTIGITISTGQLVSNSATLQVKTLSSFTFDGNGNATVAADLVDISTGLPQFGPIPIGVGVLTTIDTPVTGWDTVINPAIGVEGRLREDDGPLRIRRANSTAAASQNIIEALIGAVGDVIGVTTSTVLENDLDPVDVNGVPGHSFEVIVTGGLDVDVGDAIWTNKPTGIGAAGTDSVIINDSQGLPHTIKFTRPLNLDIFVDVTLNKRPEYPADGDDLIKQAIVDYSNGLLVSGRSFSVGEDVIFSELYTPINVVDGHDILDLRIGLSASPTGVVNIPVAIREISLFTIANINIL